MAQLFRPLAIVAYPAIGVLSILFIFSPSAVVGIPASTIAGGTMMAFFAWGAIVGLTYSAWFSASGFGILFTAFTIATFSDKGLQNDLRIYSIVGIGVLLIMAGAGNDEPTHPFKSRTSE
jgi:hypothetical protein